MCPATQLDDMFELIDLLNDIIIKLCLYIRTTNCPLTTQECLALSTLFNETLYWNHQANINRPAHERKIDKFT